MIELGKKYMTSDGRPVRLLATNLKGPYPVVGAITEKDGTEYPQAWTGSGEWHGVGSDRDCLVPVPEPTPVVHQMWAVMEDGSDTIKYSSYCKQDAEWHCNVFLHETIRIIQWNT
jgi:hypothetical protein